MTNGYTPPMYGIPDTPIPVPPPQPPTFVEHLDWYFGHLWSLLWRVCAVANGITPIGVLVMQRVGAARARFHALLERLKFGPLPPPPQRASPRPSATARALPEPRPGRPPEARLAAPRDPADRPDQPDVLRHPPAPGSARPAGGRSDARARVALI